MFEKQIAAGMQWLDAEYPGWEAKVNLKKLALENACNCILGQQFGDYWHCQTSVGIIDDEAFNRWSDSHGFTVAEENDDMLIAESDRLYATLTAEWRAAILARRNTPARPTTPAAPSRIATLCLQ